MSTHKLKIILISVLPLTFLLAYRTAILEIVSTWNSSDNDYCAAVPFLCGYLLWYDRAKFQRIKTEPSWLLGLLVMFAGFVLYLLGVHGALGYPIRLSAYVMLVGLIILNLGSKFLRAFIFPIFLLFFTIPFPKYLLTRLTFKMQLISTQITEILFNIFGYSVYVEGNRIDLGFTQLQVIEACSGLRYALPLLLLSAVYGYRYQSTLWKRIVLILASLPLSIFINSIRILAVGIVTDRTGIDLINGFSHDAAGLIVVIISTIVIAGINAILNINRGSIKTIGKTQDTNATEPPSLDNYFHLYTCIASILLLLISAGIITRFNSRAADLPQRQSLSMLPNQIGNWAGSFKILEPDIMAATGASEAVIGNYVSGTTQIEMLITYYNNQARGGDAVHSPSGCLLGSGWNFISSRVVELKGMAGPDDFKTIQVVMQKGSEYMLVNYWYQERGRVLTDDLTEKYYLVKDSLFRGRSDGALIRLIAPIKSTQDVAVSQQSVSEFIVGLKKILPLYIPD
jgi:exosortase D (VPLPA-CTERM-specific)